MHRIQKEKIKPQDDVEKEFMDGAHSDANSGVHDHFMVRQELMTMSDGGHVHWFLIPNQSNKLIIARTHFDGWHRHTLENVDDDFTQEGVSAHKHVVMVPEDLVLPDGTEVSAGEVFLTQKDGQHEHGANSVHRTDRDGAHEHVLRLGEDLSVRSMRIDDLVGMMMMDKPVDVVIKQTEDSQELEDDRKMAAAMLGFKVEKADRRKKPYEAELDKQETTEVQTLIFPKAKFTERQARDFIDRNDFKAEKLDETDGSLRFRQRDPGRFRRLRTITLPKSGGVKATVGVRKEDRHMVDDVLKAAPQSISIAKADDEKRIVYGVVLEPDVFDAQGDTISAADIETAAHKFLKESRKIKLRHNGVIKQVKPVESFISPQAMTFSGPNGKQKVRKGSWVLGVHVDDDRLWAAVKAKALNAFSVGGTGIRTPVA